MTDVTALVLAAGAGRRYGGPKALARSADGSSWLTTVTRTLASAGLESVAVLPHTHPQTADLLAPGAHPLFVDTFNDGIGASLRAGLTALSATDAHAALVMLVDQPDLPTAVIARILDPSATGPAYRITESTPFSNQVMRIEGPSGPHLRDSVPEAAEVGVDHAVLRRAAFDGQPGHPVLIGRDHWAALIGSVNGDEGAGPYFREHHGERVECADLWDGADIDVPAVPSHITEILDLRGPDPHECVDDPENLRDLGNQAGL